MSIDINKIKENLDKNLNNAPNLAHDDLRKLLYWEGRTFENWTADDCQLGHLIRKIHHKPKETITDDEKEVVNRVLKDRLKKAEPPDNFPLLF